MTSPSESLLNRAFSLQGEHALVTGGGSGLGLSIACCFVATGARVTIVGRREAVLREACGKLGSQAAYVAADIAETSHASALVAEASCRNGPVSILVNNAGVHLKKPAVETTDDEFQTVMQTQVAAAFALSREVAPAMLEQGRGVILFIASMASLMGLPLVPAYSAAKAAYLGLVRSLAAEWSPHGIRVNAIAPGWIQSEMLERALEGDPARREKILGRTPMARMGVPDDIGCAAVYLSSPAARFVTGAVLPIDGGASIGF